MNPAAPAAAPSVPPSLPPAMPAPATDLAHAAVGHDLSPLALFLQADPIVKGVMILLLVASIACWGIIIEKIVAARRLRAEARKLAAAASGAVTPEGGLAAEVIRAGAREWHEGRDPAESRGEYRERMELAMRAPVVSAFRAAEPGLPLLATIGAVGPFVGLFGTVWGIMNSFSGIAASGDTSLAVVAPGIAEALFATAIGLVAAIPSVMAYNRFTVAFTRIRQAAFASIHELSAGMARRPAPSRAHAHAHASRAAE
ncbi:MotA/TolQ/ExbB proton channel family protein [Pararoseomonas indoligenes]|uniref:MotA/TolQ/ExbB proton channel family protein n=1 Tax=Roseomonas indoligenes TaxID=2820811 RepID=A0A940S883_9PROT|nr:MotA/TolQ/ExbB proton channel family protein [Pararoseomonas indoligenes]MBP0495670.1 MotA/TolQ/ExbB proton channel family protein [Pararoseomonas indoligenes]